MSGLTVNEVMDLAILLIAYEERPTVADLPGRLHELGGGWFTPCADIVGERASMLIGAGCLAVGNEPRTYPHRTLTPTAAGLDHARQLGAKAAPRPCAAALLWHGLRLSLLEILPPEQRSAVLLEAFRADAPAPAITRPAAGLVG